MKGHSLFSLAIALIISCFLSPAFAQKTKKPVKPKKPARHYQVARHTPAAILTGSSQLSSELTRILQTSKGNVTIGVYVKSMKYNDNLYSKNIWQPFVPASILKVLTAEAALIFLGPDYRFPTQVLTDAKGVSNGILQGNIYIVQSGDPTLNYYDLTDLMVALKAQQIQGIAGNVYIDNNAYDQAIYGPGWLWKDKKYCYAAPISASIINRNCLSLKMLPGKSVGNPAQIVTSPRYYYPAIKNNVVTTSGKSRGCPLELSTEPNSALSVNGCMAKGRYAWGVNYVISDINNYNRSLFQNLFRRYGIHINGQILSGVAPSDLSVLALHQSKPLRLLVNDMLKKSDNIIAGSLFKKMGQLFTRKQGSWENGGIAVTQILNQHAKMSGSGIRVVDGSGLSQENRLTPAQMMQVLDFAFHHYATNYEFMSALPISGVDGTLKHRMGNITRKIRAKTGTMSESGVISLAGYALSAEKEPIAFVIMVNGYHKGTGWWYRGLEDKIATALTQFKRT